MPPLSMLLRGDGMRRIRQFAFMTFVAALLCAGIAVGEARGPAAPWAKSCQFYHKGTQFVKESAKFCLQQHDQRGCQSRARVYFDACHYGGNFQKMSARARARMLLVIALSSLRPVRNLNL